MKIQINQQNTDRILDELFVAKNWGAGYSVGILAEIKRITTIKRTKNLNAYSKRKIRKN